MQIREKNIIFYSIAILFLCFITAPVQAKKTLGDAPGFLETVAEPTGVSDKPINVQIGEIIKIGLTMVGLVFMVLIVYAGIRWMTARGNEEQIAKARRVIIGAVIGLAIVVASYAITVFVTEGILGTQVERAEET